MKDGGEDRKRDVFDMGNGVCKGVEVGNYLVVFIVEKKNIEKCFIIYVFIFFKFLLFLFIENIFIGDER